MTQEIILFFVGVLVGAMNAIAGGGMLLGFPVLLAVGLPPIMANVTSNIVILPGSLSSAFGYRKYLRKVHRRYLLLMVPCLVGATIGALILRNTSSDDFQRLVPGLVLFAVILFAFQPFLHLHLHRHITAKRTALRPLVIISIALLPVAIYGGYFGAGFGFIMLAFLGFTKLHQIHQMQALKNLGGAAVALMSVVCLYSTHLINWHIGLVMAAGSLVGGYYGALLTQKIPSHIIRIIVIIIGLTTAAYLGFRTY